MAQNGTKLTGRQQQAIEALLTASSVTQAAESSGIGRRTFYRWLNDPAFTTELNSRRRVMTETALNTLRQHIGAAIETLTGLLDASGENTRLRAAKDVLELTLKVSERSDLLERIEQLERAQDDSKDKN